MGLGTIGGIVGMIASQGSQNQAQAAQQAALAGILGINVPTVAQEQVSPTTESVQGTLNPNMQSTAQIGNNAMAGISTDPRLAQAQMGALSSLQQQGQAGFTSAQLAALQNANQQAAGQAQSANSATLQNMAARGMGGSGAELAARLSNSQNAANLANTQGNQLAGQAQQNALAATAASGQLGGQMQQTQFGQQSQVAAAQNAINQFNTANQQNVIGQNTTAQNTAQSANLANAQNVANTNVGTQNQAAYYNSGLYQQQYQDQLAQASAAAGQQNNISKYYQGQAANTAGMYAGIGAGLQNQATSAATMGMGGTGVASGTGYGSGTGGQGTNLSNLGPLQATANGSSTAGWAHGGMIPGYADGGVVTPTPSSIPSPSNNNPYLAAFLASLQQPDNSAQATNLATQKVLAGGSPAPKPTTQSFSNGGLADPEIGYADGDYVTDNDVQANLAALQRGAKTTTNPMPVSKNMEYHPEKYGNPDYSNSEDAADAAEEQAQNPNIQAQLDKFNAARGMYRGGQAASYTNTTNSPQSAPSDNYGQMGMYNGGKVNVNDESTDDTDPTWAYIAQQLHLPGYAEGGEVGQRDKDLAPTKAYLQHLKDIGITLPNYDTSTRTSAEPIELPGSDNGMFNGGKVGVNNDSKDDTDAVWAFIQQRLAQPKSPGYSKGGQVDDEDSADEYDDAAPVAPQAKTNAAKTHTDTRSPTHTNTETGGSSPGGASTGGVGSGIGGAGTGGAATGGASTGGAGTVTIPVYGGAQTKTDSSKGSGSKGGSSKGADDKKAPVTINVSNVGGTTGSGKVASGDGPGSAGTGGKGDGSGGGGGGAAPDEPKNYAKSTEGAASSGFANGGEVDQVNYSRVDEMSPEELDMEIKKLQYLKAKKKFANGGEVESADSSQKTLGAAIGYPGSQPSPQPSTTPKSYKQGGAVPGKAKVPGDSPKNDTVHAKLSPGEIVIPRSIVGSSDDAILDFIKHVMKKNDRK